MMRFIGFLLLAGCGASFSQLQSRDLCYERAEAHAQERVNRECSVGFDLCPAAADIMAELETAQEACK